MRTRIFAAALALAAMGLTGCVCGLQRPHQAQPSGARAKVGLLGGTSWALLDLNGATVDVTGLKARPHLEFSTDGRLSGMAGCNGMFGVFEADSENLKFDGLGTTKMFCPTGMDTEGRLLEALDRTSRYSLNADTLSFHDSSSASLARFVVRDAAQ